MASVSKKLRLSAKIDALNDVLAFIDENLEMLDCPMKAQTQIDIAVEEIYVNIAHYAYPNENEDGKGEAIIKFDSLEGENGVRIAFIDYGVQFDPLKKPDPDITLSVEEREIGGLGIYMVKKSMDSVKYEYKEGCNILTIEKMF